MKANTGKNNLKARILRNITGYIFISPWLICFLSFSLIPMVFSVILSFTDYDILSSPVYSGLKNFRRMLTDELFWKSLRITFFYAFVSVPLKLFFAFFVAVLFKSSSRIIRVYQTLYYIPSVIGGSIAISIMWRRLFSSDGAINALLQSIGINSSLSWIGRTDTAIWVIMLLSVWQFGSSMLIFLAGLRQIPQAYYEAASIDGAGAVKKFLHITVPQMTPIIFFNLIMQLINGFTSFTQAFVISGGQGYPQFSTLVYSLYLYMRAFNYNNMGYSSAMAWVLVFIVGILTVFVFKTSDKWVFYES
jgi:multiple sugar transport system permease protein